MSSQLVSYGFIEIPVGSEQENSDHLSSLRNSRCTSETDLLRSISQATSGWPSPMLAFARSIKKTENDLQEALQQEFEFILGSINALSARLNIEDDEGLVNIHLVYSFGPTKFGEPDTWTCVSQGQICNE